MKALHLLDRDQLRLLADPLRQEILGLLCRGELSTAQLTDRLIRPPSNLYYHVNRLRKAGLIRVVRSRRVRGAVEVFYRAVAESFTAPPGLLRTGRDAAQSKLAAAVETMAQGVVVKFGGSVTRGLIGSGPGQTMPMITKLTVRTTPRRIEQLRRRLERCIRAFHEEPDVESDDAIEYVLLDMFFPVEHTASPKREPKRGSRGRSGGRR
jgi:DNA-binding transcriptional ArsR family regulator